MSCCGEFVPAADGGGGGGAGVFALPEQWAQQDVAANQAAVALSAQVSTNFDTIAMIRSGSLVGLRTRFTEPITAGTATIIVTINGVASALLLAHTAGSNPSGGAVTSAVGVIPYVAGDLIGVTVTTDAGFLPISTDVEVWIEVSETP